jgi:tetratricopeptide (TPR) repeat protein
MTRYGWMARELALVAGVSPNRISAYIWEEDALSRERLEELGDLMELGPLDVERAVIAARLALPPPLAPWSPVDPSPEERLIDEQAAAMAAGELIDFVLDVRLREHRNKNRSDDLEEGRRLARELLTESEADRRVLIEGAPEYQHWGLAFVLCADSEAAAPRKPSRALELAELALLVARNVALDVPGSEGFRSRLEGWCTGFVANAQKVAGGDLPVVEKTFACAWSLWRAGDDPAGLLSEAYLLDMEASLRRAQRRLPLALKLHEDALKLAWPEEVGIILLNQAVTRKESDDPEGALRSLERAAQVIDGDRQPRLRCVLLFNRASSLILLGRAKEAVPLVEEVWRLAERLRNETDLIKTLWLDGKCLAGLGRREEALIKLEQVRHELEEREQPFDYGLASLDVALLYREEGRFPEIKALAAEMLGIFKAQEVHREAIAAVILFQEAAGNERVTVELIRQLQDYLEKARNNPQLRFEG